MVASALALVFSLAAVGAGVGDAMPDRLTGVVISPDGRPAPGAELIAAGGDGDGGPPASMGRATADEQGRFSLELPAGACVCDRPTLWAHRPGSVAASVPIDRAALAGLPIRLTLGSPSHAGFVVAGPDGKPVAGARVLARRLSRDDLAVPDALADRLSATTDGQGRATLDAFRPEELVGVRVEAAGFGIQARDFRGRDGQADVGVKGITLIAPGRVAGRVSADDPAAVAGLKVWVTSSTGGREILDAGLAQTTTDGSGRFEVAAIAAGSVAVRVIPRPGAADLPTRVARRTLEPGRSVEVEVPLRRGVRVTGLARDARDGRAVAGAWIAVVPSGPVGPIRVRTDAEGRYETFIPAGLATHRVLAVPDRYLCPPGFLGPRAVEVPPAIASFELPPIELTRGLDLRGSVVDDGGRPAPGARVEASWTLFDGRIRAPRSASATARPDGSFELGPVDPEAELALSASLGVRSTAEPVPARASGGQPIHLTIVEPDASSPAGRVVDAEGRPVADASVRIWEVSGSSGGTMLSFDGSDHLKADARGQFRGPRRLRPVREYRALAGAEGHLPGRTRPIRPGPPGVLTFPDIVLPREPRRVAVEGRVLDRRGLPVAGAEVRAEPEGPCCRRTLTDHDGRFRLEDLAEGRHLLFAEAEGFRFDGRAIDAPRGPIEITLTRLDEIPTLGMRTRSVAPPTLTLPRAVLAPYVERVLTGGDHATRIRTLELLARLDPGRVLALIEARGIEDLGLADHLRQAAAAGLIGSDAERALAAVAAIRDRRWRALAYLDAADALPPSARALKREWVEHALRDARGIGDPSGRVVALAGVAGRLIDLGEVDHGGRLLAEVRPVVEALPGAAGGGRARAAFAEALARVDPANALALTENLVDPGAFDRCRLKIARSLAGRDPAEAARVLATLRDPAAITAALPGLCHAMAPVDPGLARRLIAQARPDDPCLPAYALGMMALAVSTTDKPAATDWLREAFDLLTDLAGSGPSPPGVPHDPAAVAAALLPVAERIDPKLVPELFWRAASLHVPGPSSEVRSGAAFALLMARYDRSVALAIFEPLAARTLASPEAHLEPLIAAAAALDPDLAARLVDEIPDAPDLAFHHPKNEARLALAAALARPAPACWNHAVSRFLHLWTSGPADRD